MSTRVASLLAAVCVVVLSPRAARAQEGVTVTDFAGSTATSLTSTGSLRRGTTSTVKIVKNLIDLVPDGTITLTGGGTRGSVTHGRTNSGTGFISMPITVSSGQNPGSTITLNVGLTDHYAFLVTREGLIATVAFQPDPKTVTGGTPIKVTITGTDFGRPAIIITSQQGGGCHTVTVNTLSSTTLTATLTRNGGGCASFLGPFNLSLSGGGGALSPFDPRTFAKSNGTKVFSFGPYVAP